MSAPRAAVVVSTHDRPVRLRWLLNALSEQSFPPESFEVIVAHDSRHPDTERLLQTHPLRAAGRLRHLTFPPASVMPGAKRNAGWRATGAGVILFTDDDCRPDPDWVARGVATAAAHPGAVIQGATLPDPEEAATLRGAPWAHTVVIHPPTAWAETCNIVYPRELLERVGGFDPDLRVGEDTDLAVRASGAGAQLVGAPELVVYHAVEERSLFGAVRGTRRWRDMALLAKRHPAVRRDLWGGIWWKREHAALMAAALGGALAPRRPAAALLAAPWIALASGHRGYGARGLVRSALELPGRAVIDGSEIAALVRGSVRYRTVLL